MKTKQDDKASKTFILKQSHLNNFIKLKYSIKKIPYNVEQTSNGINILLCCICGWFYKFILFSRNGYIPDSEYLQNIPWRKA